MAETPDNQGYYCCLLDLYDDSKTAETPDILGYDCFLLGLYDDSMLAETTDNLGVVIAVYWARREIIV